MYCTFPIEWDFGDNPSDGFKGKPVNDAGTIYIVRDEDIESDWKEKNSFLAGKTSLNKMVLNFLNGARDRDGYTAELHYKSAIALAEALTEAANLIYSEQREPK